MYLPEAYFPPQVLLPSPMHFLGKFNPCVLDSLALTLSNVIFVTIIW